MYINSIFYGVTYCREEWSKMKNGDIVLNVENRMIVTFEGYIGGTVSTYKINVGATYWETYTGTIEGLLRHCANKIKAMNEHTTMFGGRLV
jgi:hypothetical protein